MIGQQIGQYKVLEKLGQGGMGVVYKARDSKLERLVALKVLPPEMTRNIERRARFLQEARAASGLNHPHIVTIYDFLTEGESDVLVMEFIDGKTLDQSIPRTGMRPSEALRIAVHVADALAAAHRAGIVHRDLKPGNVMVAGSGQVKVLDFGLAKLTERGLQSPEDATLTNRPQTDVGTIVGTASYMSPEQAEGLTVDARSDIFSFGAMLYEMVTGRRAFQGETPMATLSKVMRDEPGMDGVPIKVQWVLQQCLRKNRDRRWQHMDDVRVAVEQLKEESDSGTPIGPASAVVTKRRWLQPLLAAALLIAVAGWLVITRLRTQGVSIRLVPLTSYAGAERSPSFSPDGTQIAFIWDGGKQGASDVYVRLVAGGEPLRLTTDSARKMFASWSPDGRWIAFLRETDQRRAALALISPLGGEERKIAEVQPVRPSLSWSPDGKWLAVTDSPVRTWAGFAPGGGIYLVSASTGEKYPLTTARDSSAIFSPRGDRIIFLRSEGSNSFRLFRLQVSDGKAVGEPEPLPLPKQGYGHPAWTPDGKELVVMAGRSGSVRLYRAVAGPTAKLIPIEGAGTHEGVGSVTISRQGKLAFTTEDSEIHVVKADLEKPGGPVTRQQEMCPSTHWDRHPRVSPDGKRVAFVSTRTGQWEVWTCSTDGTHPYQVTSSEISLGMAGLAWSPDGSRLLFYAQREDGDAYFLVGANGGAATKLIPAVSSGEAVWPGDGEWIYYSKGRDIWKIRPEGGSAEKVADGSLWGFSGDGTSLFVRRGNTIEKMPVASGSPTELLKLTRSVLGLRFSAFETGVYYLDSTDVAAVGPLIYQPFHAQDGREIPGIDRATIFGLSVSADGRTIYYSRLVQTRADIYMLEGFK